MELNQKEKKFHLARRQQCACLIQEIGSRLQTTQVVINAAIYYMHNVYEVFSPETIKPIMVALPSLYIACKTEDFSRKLSLLIKAAYDTLRKTMPNENSDSFKRLVQNIHALEAAILMIIGFKTLEVKQPHVLLINAIRANSFPKEISHTSYYVCTNMLHLTTIILRHSVEAIAASCLYIAAKWNSTDIKSSSGEWYHVFSPSITLEEIKLIAEEFTTAFQACDLKIREQLQNSLRSRKLDRYPRDDPAIKSTNLKRVPSVDQRQSVAKQEYTKHNYQRLNNGGVAVSAARPYHNQPGVSGQPAPGQAAQYMLSRAGMAVDPPDAKRQRLDRNNSGGPGTFAPYGYADPSGARPRDDYRGPRYPVGNNIRPGIGKPGGHTGTLNNASRPAAPKNDLHDFF